MIEIKVACNTDIDKIKKILKLNNLKVYDIESFIENCMITYDNDMAVATAGFIKLKRDIALIKFIAVLPHRQREYIGDGLMKALLNLADKKGLKRVFVITNTQHLFFEKVGFKKVLCKDLKDVIDILSVSQDQKVLGVNLPDYFKYVCKASKGY